jgi:hypothetical protein
VLKAIQYQGRGDSPGQPTATKLPVGLNLDLHSPATDRCRGSTGDKPALVQDAQTGIVNLMRKMVHLCSKERTIGGFVLS